MEENTHVTTETEGPRPVKRLTRRTERRLVAGVSGGLADYTDLDPVLFRILFVVLTLTGGAGILMYLVAWIMIPRTDQQLSIGERFVRRFRGPTWLGVLLLGGAALLLAQGMGLWTPATLWAIALIAVGIVLLRDDPSGGADYVTPDTTESAVDGVGTEPTSVKVRQPRPRRPRSPLGYLTVAAALLVVGIVAVLGNVGALHPDAGDYFALILVIIGVGLAVGAWWGRSRLMIPLGILVLPFLLAASVLDMPLDGMVGDLQFFPHSVGRIEKGYEFAAGSMVVDLSDVPFEAGTTHMPVKLAAGELDILVPRSVQVDLTSSTDVGELWAFGNTSDGTNLLVQKSFGPELDKHLMLDVEAGVASVSIQWNDYFKGRLAPDAKQHQRQQERDKPHHRQEKSSERRRKRDR